jgi:hypothetical protein
VGRDNGVVEDDGHGTKFGSRATACNRNCSQWQFPGLGSA